MMPWEKYQAVEEQEQKQSSGPWSRYQPNAEVDNRLEQDIVSNVDLGIDGPKGEEVVTLPEPSESMYEGVDPEDRTALYEAYRRHPRTKKDWMGNLVYNGKPVPKPVSFSRQLEESGTGVVLGSAWNAAKEAVTNPAAVGEMAQDIENPILRSAATVAAGPISSVAGVLEGDQAKVLDENIPEFRPETGFGRFVSDALEYGAGALVGDKAVTSLVPKATGMIAKGARGLARFLGAEAGGTATMDNEIDTLLVGLAKDNPTINALVFDENGEYNRERVNQKLTQLQDGLLLGGLVGGPVRLAEGGLKLTVIPWYKAWKNWNNLDAEERKFVEGLIMITEGIGENPSRQQVQDAYARVGDYMEKNLNTLAQFKSKLGDPDVEDIKIANDSISNLINMMEKKDPKAYAREIQQLKSLRASALGGDAPELTRTLQEGKEGLDKSLTNFKDSREFDRSIPQTTEMVQKRGRETVDETNQSFIEAEGDLAKSKRQTEDILRNDPSFGPMIKDAEAGKQDFNPNKAVDNTADEIAAKSKENLRGLEMNAAEEYEKINPSSVLDKEQFSSKVGIDPKLVGKEEFDEALNGVLGDLPSDLRKSFLDADYNFKNLVNEVKPQLNKYINELIRSDPVGHREKIGRLRQLSEAIKSSDPQALKELEQADSAFKKEVSPYRQGLPEELKNIERSNIGKPDEIAVDSRKAVKNTLNDSDAVEHQNRVRELLNISGDAKKIDDYYIGNAAVKIRDEIIDSGNISDASIKTLRKSFEGTNLSPEAKKRFEDFVTAVRDKKISLDEKVAKVEELRELAKNAEDEVLGNQLKEFFKKNGVDGYSERSNGFQIFKEILNKEDGVQRVQSLLKVSDDPVVKKAWQAAWAKEAKDKLFSNDSVPDVLSKGEDNTFRKVGEELYGKEVVDVLESLAARARADAVANKTRMGQGFDHKANQTAFSSAVRGITTFIFGVLNPTAAKISVISRDFLKKYDSTDLSMMAGDKILANSEEFLKILRKMEAEKRMELSPQEKMIIRKSFIPGFKGMIDDDDESTFMEKVQKGANKVQKAKEQTEEIFK